jgi:hypothetical protein
MTLLMNDNTETIRDDKGKLVAVYRERPAVLDPMADEEKPTFRTLSLDDIDSLPEPEWLISGVLPATSMTTLYGAPGAAKSFWALDAALSVATGHPFHGSDTKQGTVVYSLGEGIRGLKYRIEAWCLAHPTADRELLREHFRVIPKAVHLLEQREAAALINTIDAIGDVSLLIIDTMARAMVGGDENSAGDVGLAVSVCDRVRDISGAATLIVHHMDANGTKARGSTALPGASDAMIKMVKDDIQHVITVSCTKMKDGEPFKSMYYSLERYGHSAALLPKAVADSGEKFRGRSQYSNDRNPF